MTSSSSSSSSTLMPLVPPVVLLGPPGAGKSTIAPVLARRLGFRCIELDDVVGVHHLQTEGLASFRVREYLALKESIEGGAVVVAAGAGVVDTAPARELLQRCLCLAVDVEVEVALSRIPDGTRPWLPARGDPSRTRAYVEREADRGAHRAALAAAHVDGSGSTEDAVEFCAAAIGEFVVGEDHDVVVSDIAVGFCVVDARSNVDGDFVVDVSDEKKKLPLVEQLLTAFVRAGLSKRDLVVGVGGGLLLDVVGLAASLHHRGTPWHAVPTTLLSMVDAALGGKTAVDVDVDGARVRNAAGAFHAPVGCTLDVRFLRTLSPAQLRHGRAEMDKHALLGGFDLDIDNAGNAGVDGEVSLASIQRSRRVKRFVVNRDPHEQHLRQCLNLGHTFAHGVESRFGVPHGDAVLFGLQCALRVSVEVAGFDRAAAEDLVARLKARGAPPLRLDGDDVRAVLLAMGRDKKRAASDAGLRLVLLRRPGHAVVATVPRDVVRAALIHTNRT